ncbi:MULTISPECIES: hypothetical protein [Pedobacter]|uniref:Uncharacterized protein n=1 Tax=Pedobacter heparinus (strain ATCC 13125 / DSM 2366 / CIP 104194 / JCM 7457 / NBRC 12017 / NCIMB 9290 / NRRL B-14731 / HIM 762-3) TaxID=485917 RepID=C6XUC6_PEDHD|nr:MULTISPECIES: hypothetical protein [Pedobacter]ACU05919.1 hypothetical protein Phep_3728 [Pedobacter heparinus DSM 2366]MBB5438697.1 putative transposase YdaD [Pedobacter sp. AK017]
MNRAAQKREWDYYSVLESAKEERALAEKKSIAKNFKIKGVDLKVIADATGLSIEEIVAL